MEINADQLPGCCGVEVFFDFPEGDGKSERAQIAKLKAQLAKTTDEDERYSLECEIEDLELDLPEFDLDEVSTKKLGLATLLEKDQSAAAEQLIKAGWVKIGTFKSANTGNILGLYANKALKFAGEGVVALKKAKKVARKRVRK